MKHIHVYFNESSKDTALDLRKKINIAYPELRLGIVHENPVGPHPEGSYLVLLPESLEESVLSFLEENHQDLSILIHPLSGNDAEDHKDEAIRWIGTPQKLNHAAFH